MKRALFLTVAVIFAVGMLIGMIGCSEDEEEEKEEEIQETGDIFEPGTTPVVERTIDVAISMQSGWMDEETAEREMGEVISNVEGKVNSIKAFAAAEEGVLASWLVSHTNNGQLDLLILCDVFPDSIYRAGNAQPDGSIAERFLDAGNMIINTGDYVFYVSSKKPDNLEHGLKNMMDLPRIDMWSGGPMEVTAEGRKYLPSLEKFNTVRALRISRLESPWVTEIIFAGTDMAADPVVVRNVITGGRIGIFYELGSKTDPPRGKVISEFILNWLLTAN